MATNLTSRAPVERATIAERYDSFVWGDPPGTAPVGLIRWVLQIATMVLEGFRRHRTSMMAAQLAFLTLLSIVPVLAIAFTFSTSFDSQIRPWILNELEGSKGLRDALVWILDTAAETNVTALGGVGFLILLGLLVRMLVHTERSFNQIWNVKRGRQWIRKVTDSIALVVLGPLFVVVVAGITGVDFGKAESIVVQVPVIGELRGSTFASLGIVWFGFTMLHLIVPNRRVAVRSAMIAGILSGTVFELALKGYIALQVGLGQTTAIYGAFAAIPVFFVWVDLSWLIVLSGAELAAAIEGRRHRLETLRAESISPEGRLALGLNLLADAAERYEASQPPIASVEAMHRHGAPEVLVRELADRLSEAGLVEKSADPEILMILARDPAMISIQEVLDTLPASLQDRQHADRLGGRLEVDRVLGEIEAATRESIAGLSVRDLLSGGMSPGLQRTRPEPASERPEHRPSEPS